MARLRRSYGVHTGSKRRFHWPRRLVVMVLIIMGLIVAGMIAVRIFYNANLAAVSDSTASQTYIIEEGATISQVADDLQEKELIRSSLVFQLYVRSKGDKNPLIAGAYRLQPNLSTPAIVSILSRGKVATDLVTILPGQRVDQIRASLIGSGFAEADVDAALDPTLYEDSPALVDKPDGASLEGYLYPDSFQRTSATKPQEIIKKSLELMSENLTPDIRAAFASQGLSTYQGLVLASVVEQEAASQADRDQVAQVFLKRLAIGMPLQSDPTGKYGAVLAGKEPQLGYESPYNTYTHTGLMPTPISNVSKSSLQAVAKPANTDWLYFVAGDDGTVHFSNTIEEHEHLTQQYCTKLCGN